MRDQQWDRAVQTSRAVGQEEAGLASTTLKRGERAAVYTDQPPLSAQGQSCNNDIRVCHSCQYISAKPSLRPIFQIFAPITTTTTTTNYPHLLVRATDRAFTWPEAQGPVSTVSCMGRGAAGTHASWQMGARAWMGISPAHRITIYRCL